MRSRLLESISSEEESSQDITVEITIPSLKPKYEELKRCLEILKAIEKNLKDEKEAQCGYCASLFIATIGFTSLIVTTAFASQSKDTSKSLDPAFMGLGIATFLIGTLAMMYWSKNVINAYRNYENLANIQTFDTCLDKIGNELIHRLVETYGILETKNKTLNEMISLLEIELAKQPRPEKGKSTLQKNSFWSQDQVTVSSETDLLETLTHVASIK